jgi:polysaccharide biosynthesis protein PslE
MTQEDLGVQESERARYATLRDWLAVGFRRRRLIVISFTGLLLGTILFTVFWAARYYESSMQILVLQDRTDPAVTSAPNPTMPTNQLVSPDQINSEMALLQGADMLKEVVVACGLDQRSSLGDFLLFGDSPEQKHAIKVEKAAKRLAKALDVEVEKQADVIDVTYGKTGSAETPACVLGDLSKKYLEKHLQTHRPTGSLDVFAQETEKYRRALFGSEEKLAALGQSNGIGAPDVQLPAIAKTLADTEGFLQQAREAAAADQQRIASDTRQLGGMSPRILTKEENAAAGLLVQQIGAQLLTAEQKRAEMLMKYDPSYPLVDEANQEVNQARDAMKDAEKMQLLTRTTDADPAFELLREDLAKTQADLASQRANATALTRSVDALKNETVELNREMIQQDSLQRDVKANEQNYLLYLGKREQERSSDAMDRKRIANVSIAVAPQVPVLPAYSPAMVFLLGLLFSLIVSIGAAFAAEYLDPSFNNPTEVSEMLRVPVLASFPRQAA